MYASIMEHKLGITDLYAMPSTCHSLGCCIVARLRIPCTISPRASLHDVSCLVSFLSPSDNVHVVLTGKTSPSSLAAAPRSRGSEETFGLG